MTPFKVAVIVWAICLTAVVAVEICVGGDYGEETQQVLLRSEVNEGEGESVLRVGLLDAPENPVWKNGEEGSACNPLGQGISLCSGVCGCYEDPAEQSLIDDALVELGYFREDVPLIYELQDVLHTECEKACVPYEMALGLIQTESNFCSDAVSPHGCYGLMQLNPIYFPSGLTDAENIKAGIQHLGDLIDRYGDTAAALTAYHAGRDTGDRGYANAVLDAAEEWSE